MKNLDISVTLRQQLTFLCNLELPQKMPIYNMLAMLPKIKFFAVTSEIIMYLASQVNYYFLN